MDRNGFFPIWRDFGAYRNVVSCTQAHAYVLTGRVGEKCIQEIALLIELPCSKVTRNVGLKLEVYPLGAKVESRITKIRVYLRAQAALQSWIEENGRAMFGAQQLWI